ncbi:MAG: hypothetical protein EBS41_05460 [Actinobacteria bacterium]|nr:hypothetical protein [Actinomycetota bacterium]
MGILRRGIGDGVGRGGRADDGGRGGRGDHCPGELPGPRHPGGVAVGAFLLRGHRLLDVASGDAHHQ